MRMDTADIIMFPSAAIHRTPPQNNEAAEKERLKRNKQRFVENVVHHYGIQLINKLALHGFDVDDPTFMYDYIFAMETVRSCLYRNVGIFHPLQKLSDNSESIVGDSEFDIEIVEKDDEPES